MCAVLLLWWHTYGYLLRFAAVAAAVNILGDINIHETCDFDLHM